MSRERDRDRRDDSLYRDDRRDREGRRNYDRRHGDDRRSRGQDGRGSYSQRFPFIAADQRPPVHVLTIEAYMHMLPVTSSAPRLVRRGACHLWGVCFRIASMP